MAIPDVAVIGGGIIGTAAAYFLAKAGARTTLYEREAIAAGASGRNAGNIGRPFDPVLVPLYEESLQHYSWLARQGLDFSISAEPAGLLLIGRESVVIRALTDTIHAASPGLAATYLEGDELQRAEPVLADDLAACRLAVGHPTVPGSATRAFAELAAADGADLHLGEAATVGMRDGRAAGVLVNGELRPAGSVVLAAGAWTSEALDREGSWRPIRPQFGVIVELELPTAPRHVLEEASMVQIFDPDKIAKGPGYGPAERGPTFSLITANGKSALGATFSDSPPDEAATAEQLVDRGQQFIPNLRTARPSQIRTCARPGTRDGRPLIGRVPGIEGAFIAAGHGAWGISTGPASARMIADMVVGREVTVQQEFAPSRFLPR